MAPIIGNQFLYAGQSIGSMFQLISESTQQVAELYIVLVRLQFYVLLLVTLCYGMAVLLLLVWVVRFIRGYNSKEKSEPFMLPRPYQLPDPQSSTTQNAGAVHFNPPFKTSSNASNTVPRHSMAHIFDGQTQTQPHKAPMKRTLTMTTAASRRRPTQQEPLLSPFSGHSSTNSTARHPHTHETSAMTNTTPCLNNVRPSSTTNTTVTGAQATVSQRKITKSASIEKSLRMDSVVDFNSALTGILD